MAPSVGPTDTTTIGETVGAQQDALRDFHQLQTEGPPVPTHDLHLQDGLLSVSHSDEGAQVRLSLQGELDLSNVPTFEGPLEAAIESGKKVLVDLDQLEFLDSTGLALIVKMLGRRDSERFSFVPSRHPSVCRVLSLTGLDQRMVIATAEAEPLPVLPTA